MSPKNVDVLCVGHACYDIIFAVKHHPDTNEKMLADKSFNFGGGPAANAAVAVARLGGASAFTGYLGRDMHGDHHLQELQAEGVLTEFIERGDDATPFSAILVKPDGSRSVVNYRNKMYHLNENHFNFSTLNFKTLLLDGHEPYIAQPLLQRAKAETIPVVLDAGSVHVGSLDLMHQADYLVASKDFALQYTGKNSGSDALPQLYQTGLTVVITLGPNGLIWKNDTGEGVLPAFKIQSVDTTGCGDTFHGAFAYGIAQGMSWQELLRYASAAAALCATKYGARPGIPTAKEVAHFLQENDNH
jgi:sulfofructose kinase